MCVSVVNVYDAFLCVSGVYLFLYVSMRLYCAPLWPLPPSVYLSLFFLSTFAVAIFEKLTEPPVLISALCSRLMPFLSSYKSHSGLAWLSFFLFT